MLAHFAREFAGGPDIGGQASVKQFELLDVSYR
jgi:hypothetical protein